MLSTQRHTGGARERVQHHARRLADGDDVNRRSARPQGGEAEQIA